MSVAAVNWALQVDAERPSSKLVLLVLAWGVRYNAEDWTAYASVDDLAAATHLDRKTILDALKRLCAIGIIKDSGLRAGSTRRITVWRLNGQPAEQPICGTAPSVQEHALTSLPARPAPSPHASAYKHLRNPAYDAGTRLPDQWTLPGDWREWARRVRPRWSMSRIEAMATTFHAYWRSKPGAAGYSADWFASWRLWVLREAPDRTDESSRGARPIQTTQSRQAWLLAQARAAGIEAAPGESTEAYLARAHIELERRAAGDG
ncbi:Uncharacterized protein conserved in bacteria [Bordetella ansorpii]|uniref:Uncharacterized protein conserved in bacteria n=1 Tax=Bordetella ansorpii TaxID=288768 RepID=A0A157SRM8_9BORD|nr:helix-turn-helix domain-containing protein [Bordetella ansorpii]SAI73158.1 Uncharacterized protein conserved in bacteria [Bordetella ansorpii]